MSKDFLKAVFEDEKELMLKSEVRFISISHYEEMSVRKLWIQLKDDE